MVELDKLKMGMPIRIKGITGKYLFLCMIDSCMFLEPIGKPDPSLLIYSDKICDDLDLPLGTIGLYPNGLEITKIYGWMYIIWFLWYYPNLIQEKLLSLMGIKEKKNG